MIGYPKYGDAGFESTAHRPTPTEGLYRFGDEDRGRDDALRGCVKARIRAGRLPTELFRERLDCEFVEQGCERIHVIRVDDNALEIFRASNGDVPQRRIQLHPPRVLLRGRIRKR